MSFDVKGSAALVTGANEGIGKGFVEVLLERGAKKIYATARRPQTLDPIVALDPERIVPLQIDVVNDAHRKAAAARATDVNLVINNAGIAGSLDKPLERRFIAAESLDDAREVFEVDFFAQAEMCRAFAPILVANKGAFVNISSIGAIFCYPEYSTYSAAKAAMVIMTMGVRAELAKKGVFVACVYPGAVESRMSAKNKNPKTSAPDHARQVFDALKEGVEEIFAGNGATAIRDAVHADAKAFERNHIERFNANPVS